MFHHILLSTGIHGIGMSKVLFAILVLLDWTYQARVSAGEICGSPKISNGGCIDGFKTCSCADDTVHNIPIGCCMYTSCIDAYPCAGQENKLSCAQTTNCLNCEIKGRNLHCSSCVNNAWETDGTLDCGKDIDECSSGRLRPNQVYEKPACEHNEFCKNLEGSYICERCRDGYKLVGKRECSILSCRPPPIPDNGAVTPTKEGQPWEYRTFGVYSCSTSKYGRPLILNGVPKNRCLAKITDMFWENSAPKCSDPCHGVQDKTLCVGNQDHISEDECYQRGCCFNREYPPGANCFKSSEKLFIGFSRDKPNNAVILHQFHSDSQGCAFLCSNTSGCMGYFLHNTSYSGSAEVLMKCHLLASSRSEIQFSHDSRQFLYYSLLLESNKHDTSDIESFDNIIRQFTLGCIRHSQIKNEYIVNVIQASAITVRKCYEACRSRDYRYAMLSNGQFCNCVTSIADLLDDKGQIKSESDTLCDTPCSGRESESCGGEKTSSLYYISHDDRYLGCYSNDLLTTSFVKIDDNKFSPHDCVMTCRHLRPNFSFAGVSQGGNCWCSNGYSEKTELSASKCNMQCEEGTSLENCGGKNAMAIYTTEKDLDPSVQPVSGRTRRLYFADNYTTELPMFLFTEYPLLRSVISSRLIIHATQEVLTPNLHKFHYSEESYALCGEIKSIEQAAYKGRTYTIRAFEYSLDRLKQSVGPDTRQVYIYAHIVYITRSEHFEFSLLIRARRIVIDRNTAFTISVSPDTPTIDVDMKMFENDGPPPDPLFLKISYVCVRLLFDRNEIDLSSLAWKMLYDLTKFGKYQSRVNQVILEIQSYKSLIAGIQKEDIHFVPQYNQKYYGEMLAIVHDRVVIYNKKFSELKVEKDLKKYSSIIGEMLNIQMECVVKEAAIRMEHFKDSVRDSLAAFDGIRRLYIKSRQKILNAPPEKMTTVDTFCSAKNNVHKVFGMATAAKYASKAIVDTGKAMQVALSSVATLASAAATGPLAILGALSIIMNLLTALFDNSAKEEQDKFQRNINNIKSAVSESVQVISNIEGFFDLMNDIKYHLDKNEPIKNSERYLKNSGNFASLKTGKIKFENLKNAVSAIMSNKLGSSNTELLEYMKNIMDYSNAAAGLADSSLELYENIRQFLLSQTIYQTFRAQDKLFKAQKEKLGENTIPLELMTANMVEQMFDVELELNNYLNYFCQSFFYLHLIQCPETAKPKFGEDIIGLLSRISLARSLALTSGVIQDTQVSVNITDKDTSSNCIDHSACPVRSFRNTGILKFNITLEEPQLLDLEFIRANEMKIRFIGATSRRKDKGVLSMSISSGGVFFDRNKNSLYTFISSAFQAQHQYDVRTGQVKVATTLFVGSHYQKYVTPFTSWTVKLLSVREKAYLDFSSVNKVEITFIGGARIRTTTQEFK